MSKNDKAKSVGASGQEQSFGIASRVVVSGVLAGALVFGVGGWAAQAKLAGAVIAHGQLVVPDQVKTIQHRDGGIVAEIPVANGDAVKAGDVLLRLDETQTRVELTIIQSQLAQLRAMKTRLEGERDGSDTISFADIDIAADLAGNETKLFLENRRMIVNQKQQLEMQINQLKDQIDGLFSQRTASEAEKEIIAKEIEVSEKLAKGGLIKLSEYRDLQKQVARIDGARGEVVARVAEAEGEISELRIKLLSIDQTTRSETQKEIVNIESKLAELGEREIAARDRLSRMEVRAPVDGYVYDLQTHTISGVISAGAPIMSIVPTGDDMKVEIRVPPVDIDRVEPGQSARMRLTSFNSATTPEVPGTVEFVAGATVLDKSTGQPYYLATVSMDLEKAGLTDRKLMPGMPIEVYVHTAERSAWSYLTKPFTDQVMKAFREE
ncbi:HlyD family type I secretion periplasmic adaptor subunit [Agrobacterium larrymoorei]|uniref:HlyD family type I secretion periplasmic adaptor subunit n=1 Tax=Agrobacterium larrymoorei TaxID=160699 RepID=UPI0015745F71|nr:HlyD family type I secretion periplasmic adaptor subunit [Agrobacterium larrymoorei]NTJ43911.1 HlyD family type I secretion periplasmic adaptor subunit [Agrobacterium larrymoorei]